MNYLLLAQKEPIVIVPIGTNFGDVEKLRLSLKMVVETFFCEDS